MEKFSDRPSDLIDLGCWFFGWSAAGYAEEKGGPLGDFAVLLYQIPEGPDPGLRFSGAGKTREEAFWQLLNSIRGHFDSRIQALQGEISANRKASDLVLLREAEKRRTQLDHFLRKNLPPPSA